MIMSGTPPSPLPAVPLLRKPGLFGWPLSQDQDALRGCSAPWPGIAKPAVLASGAVAGVRRDRSSSIALMSAPVKRTIAEIHIHISITTAPPMAPYVLLYSPKCRTSNENPHEAISHTATATTDPGVRNRNLRGTSGRI